MKKTYVVLLAVLSAAMLVGLLARASLASFTVLETAQEDDWYATFEYLGVTYAVSENYQEGTWYDSVDYCSAMGEGWRLPTLGEGIAMRNDYVGNDPFDIVVPDFCQGYENNSPEEMLWTSTDCDIGAYTIHPNNLTVIIYDAPQYGYCENESGDNSHCCCVRKSGYGIIHVCPQARCVRVLSGTPVATETPRPTRTPTPDVTDTPGPTPTETSTADCPDGSSWTYECNDDSDCEGCGPGYVCNQVYGPDPCVLATATPTIAPSDTPTIVPSDTPTIVPSDTPTIVPSDTPTTLPGDTPTIAPSDTPTIAPSDTPTIAPSDTPTIAPSDTPTIVPTNTPTIAPSVTPTESVTPTATVAPDAWVAVSPSDVTVTSGETFTISVIVEGVSDMAGYEFGLAFDPSVVTVLDVEDGGFLGSLGHSITLLGPNIDNTHGEVAFGAFAIGAGPWPEGDGTLAVLRFEAGGFGTSELDLLGDWVMVYDGSGSSMTTETEDGSVAVASTPTLTDTPTPTEPSSPLATPTSEVPPRPVPSPFGVGDLNGDGRFGFADVLEVLRHQGARQADADWAAHEHADADDDGSVSLSDAMRVLQTLLGL